MEIRKAVLPVAGLGTRFLPATKAQPKEMLPIVDKPLVQYAVEEVESSGIPIAVFVTGRGKDAIEDHFDVSFELEHMLAGRGKEKMLEQVRSISKLVQIIDAQVPCLKQMMNIFAQYGGSVVAVQRVERKAVSNYGIIKGQPVKDHRAGNRLFRITDMVEKPQPNKAPSNLAIIGRYILTPAIFKELASTPRGTGSEIQLTDALRRLLQKEPVYGYLFEGKRYDAGDKLGFLQATVEMALKRPELGAPFRKYLKSLKI